MTREDLVGTLDVVLLRQRVYYESVVRRLQSYGRNTQEGIVAQWFLLPHTHRCPRCQATRTHTGLEVTREGDSVAHACCGHDMRRA